MRTSGLRRRKFLGAALATPFLPHHSQSRSPNETIQHASFGAGGMAATDWARLTSHPKLRLIAVADVDLARTDKVKSTFPEVRVYQDWRELLAMEDSIDSCNVSTPDHMHAPIARAALERGISVYGQKPLSHNIAESRDLAALAKSSGRTTQMGTQLASYTTDLSTIAWIQGGIIGPVKEVFSWSQKKWGDPLPLSPRTDPIPRTLDWDGWNGVTPSPVPYQKGAYHPANWRKRLAFGTGTLGDMGCHLFHSWYRALDLIAPKSVLSLGPSPAHGNWPIHQKIHYQFSGTRFTSDSTLKVTWLDGDQRLPPEYLHILGETFPTDGTLYFGEEGLLLQPLGGWIRLFRKGSFVDQATHRFRDVPGKLLQHWHEFVDAVIDDTPTKLTSPFSYAAQLTELVLLGTIASRYPGQRLSWDYEAMTFDHELANEFLTSKYRAGWTP
ncbi:MAG: Gfo/Idh/MocA family oxidoreductase [Verrucomicrobiota bacterium]